MRYPDFEWCRGRGSTYSTELGGTYWHPLPKETGKHSGQGFTSGPPDMSFVLTRVLLWFTIHTWGLS